MVQVRKKPLSSAGSAPRTRRPMSPKQAVRCCGAIDEFLDPSLFKSLCDPTRARLLSCLVKCGRACTVGEVAACCAVDLSVVSRHLQQLSRAGLLASVKSGRSVSYEVRYDDLSSKLRGLAAAIEEFRPACIKTPCSGGSCAIR